MKEPIYIDRPPRIQPELPIDVVKIPGPPKRDEDGWMRLVMMALPMLMIVGYLAIMMFGGRGRSPLMIIPMALSIGAMGVFSVYMYFREKEKQEEAERAYEERLIELSKEMHSHHDQQRRFYSYNYPDFPTVLRIAREARYEAEKADRTLRMESRIWERRTSDEDFGVVRLGLGTLPSTVEYVLDDDEDFENPQLRMAKKLEEEAKHVSPIPVIISFRPGAVPVEDEDEQEETQQAKEEESKRTPTTHALGVAGEPEATYAFTRALLSHFATFHAAQDARLFIIAKEKAPWAWADDLPHCQEEEGSSNYFHDVVEGQGAQAEPHPFSDNEENPLVRYLEGIRKVLAQRKLRLGESRDNQTGEDVTLPHLMVVIDWLDVVYDEESPLKDLESDAAISILLAEGAQLGASVIFVVPERSKIPSGCKSVVEIEETTPASSNRYPSFQKAHFRYAEVGLNTFRYVGEADVVTKQREEDVYVLASKLSELRVRESYGGSLATSVPFLEFMGYSSLRELEAAIPERWAASTQQAYADWMRARIGAMSGNKPRSLVFSAKRDGVHGMVAGSTGSGKSELLISLITAMAVTYDPSVLNFVLVDYKGGGAFKGFDELPHCVDIITNLAGEGVTRMFTAINAEMRRRQQLNTETQTKNIVEYRQKGLHLTHAPYPFLFIIIDEFAEMIADRSEFKSELESITRVGRAQGVSLILAAQRPSGVTDQMRSNIKFRICLRVETPGESREMLRRTDAAYLPGGIPGRGFLQVGNDEIELIQVAYCGDKYEEQQSIADQAVIWPDRRSYDPSEDQEPPELYKAIVASVRRLAEQHSVPEQRAPWPDFLPTTLALTDVLIAETGQPQPPPLAGEGERVKPISSDRYLDAEAMRTLLLGGRWEGTLSLNPYIQLWLNDGAGWVDHLDWERDALRPTVGLVDDPYSARQLPLVVELPRGHAAIFGASGWGKTTFVRSMIVSLAASHSPDAVHTYLLDLGGRNLSALEALPHVGAVISPDEEGYRERVEQLLRELEETVDHRKVLLGTAEMGDIYQYNIRAERPLPGIVVVIDNFTEFRETFGGDVTEVDSTLSRFVELAREARPYGIHFVVTATQFNVLPAQLHNLFSERFALKLNDPSEYRAIIGSAVPDMADIPGRGYTKVDRQGLAFQVATVVGESGEEWSGSSQESQELKRLARNMASHMARSDKSYQLPFSVGALPKAALYRHLLARKHDDTFDEQFQRPLRRLMSESWANSLAPEEADWLTVTMALSPGDRLRTLELEAKKDGVHGLIAGGTGSGKSELLMTLIVDLAVHYDPSILNFVLVDYKGGGAFKPFERLPHCVQTITNLNQSAVERMFTSINAEMQRRQKLNAETGTKDIIEYRRKGLHLSHEPYPHLFIIVDEYAEMISDNPEFKSELESITRVGRAQGVNLLLASQRPVGITDQMRANIKLRICLRVEEVETSREMLRRPDAAYLPNGVPGRGYLQVGNEGVELVQVAYTGESYPEIELDPESSAQPKFYDIVVRMAQEVLAESGQTEPAPPWPPFLPTALAADAPLSARYLDEESSGAGTVLNPALASWAQGEGEWPGVDWSQEAMRGIVGLLDDPWNARQRPFLLDIKRGHAALFGASGYGKTTFIRSLVLGLAATHSPDEFQAHLLDLGGRNLFALRSLPHVGTLVMPDERGYEERVQQLWRELNDIIDERKRLFGELGVSTLYEYNRSAERIEPALLVAIDNFGEYIESFGGQNKDDGPMEVLTTLMRQARAYGIHFIITASRPNVLSSKLYSLFTERLTLRLASADDYTLVVGGRVSGVEGIPGRGYVRVGRHPLMFQVALPPGTVELDEQKRPLISSEVIKIRELGAAMQRHIGAAAHAYREPLRIDALPKSSSYRTVLADDLDISPRGSFVAALERGMAKRWVANRTAEQADWLQVTLGVTSGNRTRRLRLEAKKDGVHGMIAGGTGSGKSELLITMLVGLAANYSPDILNFVLVDYKGGGAFKSFETLPHCVDIVTNLNKSAVERMFTAINAEIRRRQQLNADTNTKDIVDYRRKGLHLTREPYPHLFIVIDEYAEMIDDNPEYRAELESITRVGRAQGVNLILASQRPKGVTDQMRANIKLKLCLRVEQTDTSNEMLRRPDAARLPSGLPGRGYLQVGNENLELLQVSYAGEPQANDRLKPVLWPTHVGDEGEEEEPTFYDLVVSLASRLAGHKMAPKPWPSFLPSHFTLQSPIYDAKEDRVYLLNEAISDWLNGTWDDLWPGVVWAKADTSQSNGRQASASDSRSPQAMVAAVGLLDDPAEARQSPLTFNLRREHLAIYGDAGWGKSSLLRTLILGLATTHSPEELHVYVLDLGGRAARVIEELPHMGAVIYADEDSFEERLNRLLSRLEGMVSERQQLFSEAGVNGLFEYNVQHPDTRLPAILLAIDNFELLRESYEMLVETTLLPVVRRASSVGVSVVVTAGAPTSLTRKLASLFGTQITFRQNNSDRYLDIVGRGATELDEIPGRGYIRVGRRPLLFQAATPVGLPNPLTGRDTLSENRETRRLAAMMRRAIAAGHRSIRDLPPPIDTLPELLPLARLLKDVGEPQPKRVEAVIGLSGTLEPALFDLKRMMPHFMIAGPPLSGKSTVLYNWLFSLGLRYSPEQVGMILVDFQRRFVDYGGEHDLGELPHVLATIYELEQWEAILPELRRACEEIVSEESNRELFIFVDNFSELTEEVERERELAQELSTIVRRYGREGVHFVVSDGLSSSTSDLRRRILSANFGIGLRIARSLDTLRVTRTPAGFRDKELTVGRGYVVRSGQASLIQVASPYDGIPVDERADEEEQRAQALDHWVGKIKKRYGEATALWQTAEPESEQLNGHQQGGGGFNEKAVMIMALLQKAMHREAIQLQENESQEARLIPALTALSPQSLADENALKPLLREAWRQDKLAQGLSEEMIESFIDVYDEQSLIMDLQAGLSVWEPPTNGQGDGAESDGD